MTGVPLFRSSETKVVLYSEPTLSSEARQHSSSEDTFKSAVILAGMPALIGKSDHVQNQNGTGAGT
jgi:hypothetical protein